MKKNYYLFGLLTFVLLGAYKVSDNVFKFGDSTSSDKTIEADIGQGATNPKIKFNTTSSAWEFSNDGATSQPFGSGSGGGGGINLAKNPGFELSVNDWTNVGTGTFSVTTTASEVGFGDAAGLWDAGTAGDKLASAAVSVPNGMANRQCHAEFLWKDGDANITAQIVDGSANVLASQVLSTNLVYRPVGQMVFPCPSSASTLAIEFVASADAAPIKIDQVFFGIASTQTGALGGWRTYTEAEVAITSGTGGTITARLTPYKDPFNNTWRIAFNIYMVSGSSATGGSFLIDGVDYTMAGDTSIRQTCTPPDLGGSLITNRTITVPAAAVNHLDWAAGSAISTVAISCDLQLASKPTWAQDVGAVQLINDEVAFANEVFISNQESGQQAVPNSVQTVLTGWLNTYSNPNFNPVTGEYTVSSDGNFRVKARSQFFSGNQTTNEFGVFVNGVFKEGVKSYGNASVNNPLSFETVLKLSKNDKVSIYAFSDSSIGKNIASGAGFHFFSVVKLSKFTAGSTSGFTFADANNAGLVSSEEEFSAPLNGGYTGGTLTGYRIGKLVSLRFSSNGTHASATSAATLANILPPSFIPAANIFTTYKTDGGTLFRVSVVVDGSVGSTYFSQSTGALVSRTDSGTSWSASYVVP